MTEFLSLHDAIATYVPDGSTVALEGFTHLIPFAAGHEIVRQRRRDLTLIRMVEATPADGYVAVCAALRDADLRDVVSRIRAPSLILAGELDQSAPLRQSEELHTSIEGSELIVLPGAAHLTNVEQAEKFTPIVSTFLRGL